MKNFLLFVFLFGGFCLQNTATQEKKTTVYLIPGQGGDSRLYNEFELDSSFEKKHIQYFTPEKDISMKDFALELAKQIDTTQNFSIIGVSLGGMVATEMIEFLHPEKVIIISSAKSRNELPFRYRFQRKVPIYKMVPKGLYYSGAKFLQPLVEPDRKSHKETFKAMLNDKDPAFLKRTTKIIMEWNRIEYSNEIIHIHGTNDHTIPYRNVKANYLIESGSHMMVLTRADEISRLVNGILLENYQ